jgi:hypothetical protein
MLNNGGEEDETPMAVGENAFTQPGEIWLPHENRGSMGTDLDKTPGVEAMPFKRIQNADRERLRQLDSKGSNSDRRSNSPSKKGDGMVSGGSSHDISTTAEELLLNDNLIYALARRLGLPVTNITPVDELRSVFTLTDAESGTESHKGRQYIIVHSFL